MAQRWHPELDGDRDRLGRLNYGDVITVDLGPARGHVQAGARPAVVVQDHVTSSALRTTVVVPVTKNLLALTKYPHAVRVEPSSTNGISVPSVLLAFQIATIDNRMIIRRIGSLDESSLAQLSVALRALLRLPERSGNAQ